ncbi:hypothetical protein F2Q69_00021789 [Brassica cretica]|uniref:Uncharacterized protein n=1 Tax=Brassica cretica TaxID=69181 RepID=A0A8S9PY68_BRACR|nr:hypothetical protein F2Q69_00021789 [Brassica cretica]
MVKPRFCPSRYQSSPVQSRRSWGFGQVLSDQPAASRLEHCELACLNYTWKLGGLRHIGQITGTIGYSCRVECLVRICNFSLRFLTLSPNSGSGTGLGLVCISLVFPLLEARSWQETKSNLVTVPLGKDDRIAWCWTLGPPV